MPIFDGPGFFRNTLLSKSGSGTQNRVPFTFTSTARLLKSGKLKGSANMQLAAAQAGTDQANNLASIEQETRGSAALSQLGLSDTSASLQSVQQSIAGTDMSVISMAINPQAVQWTQNKRIVKRDTMQGSTFFHFTDKADQNNDILVMTFSGKTGNIDTNASYADMIKTKANLKLRVWHELYNLSREPMLLNKNTVGSDLPYGIKNEFYITYRTLLFPNQITLIGHFAKVLEFTESAEDPFNRDYNFTFNVTRTTPSLDDMSKLLKSSSSVF